MSFSWVKKFNIKYKKEYFTESGNVRQASRRKFNPSLLIEGIMKFPEVIPYLITTFHQWIGSQTFYVAKVKDKKGNEGVKVGITHNTIEIRHLEGRWENNYKIIKVFCVKYYESGIAVSKLEDSVINHFEGKNLKLETTSPGKGEMYPLEMSEEIVNYVENEYPKYEKLVGKRRR